MNLKLYYKYSYTKIYEKYKILFQYTKIHIGENLVKYTCIHVIRNFCLDYISSMYCTSIVRTRDGQKFYFSARPGPLVLFSGQTLRVGTRNLRVSCIVYRVSCIFNTRNYIHEILFVDTREYTIFEPLHEYTKNFYILYTNL